MTIKLYKRPQDWHASIPPGEGRCGCGKTVAEAIGDLVMAHAQDLEITLHMIDAPKQTGGAQ